MFNIRNHPDSLQARRGLGLLHGKTKYKGEIPDKWLWLKDAPFEVHNICCRKMKKEPFYKYEKDTGLHPILGVMASESMMRTTSYIHQGGV